MYRSGFRSLLRGRASPAISAIVIVAVFLGASLLAGVAGGLPAIGPQSHAPTAPAAAPPAGSAPVAAPPAHAAGSPVQHLSGVFYENNTTFADLPRNATVCEYNDSLDVFSFSSPPYTYYYNESFDYGTCFQGAQSPSTLTIGGNTIGTGYSVITNTSKVGCSNHPDLETVQVAFQVSHDSGASYGAPVWIGNESCAYLDGLEPSFAISSSTNHIYGAFVEANMGSTATNNTTNVTTVSATPPAQFANRTSDALAFTVSRNNGTTFSNPVTLTLAGIGNIARPVVAAFGKTVYIVYENLDNNSSIGLTNPYSPGTPFTPISLEMLTSVNGGSTWSGPVTLPGLNASSGYTSMSPSIAVNSAGEIAVAYDTNRSCFESFFGFCSGYGDDVVVSTSVTNGTTWVGPVLVSPNSTGEYQCEGYYAPFIGGPCYTSLYQWGPTTSVAWSTVSTSDVYVAWSGTYSLYNASDLSTFYGNSAVYSAASTNGGSTWVDAVVAEDTSQVYPNDLAFYYSPVINDRDGWVYVSYAEQNWSYCYSANCAPVTIGTNYYLETSLDGVTWMGNTTLLYHQPSTYIYNAFVGYSESMAFTIGGPVVTFSQPAVNLYSYFETYTDIYQNYNYWFNLTYDDNITGFADLTTAFVWAGNTTVVNFTETGLAPGRQWSFSLGSASFSTTNATIEITNVPVGPGLSFLVPTLPDGYWTELVAFPSVNSTPSFSGPTNVTVAFVIEYGIQFLVQPAATPYFYLYYIVNGNEYYTEIYGSCTGCNYTYPEFPWYFPVGTVVSIPADQIDSAFPISYWTGTGNGSSTNFGNSTTFTVNGVINETAWGGAFGSYNVTFSPEGLPSGTTYYFTFNGTAYSAVSPATVPVSGVVTGDYLVSGITAPGTGGYEYFGQVQGGDEVSIPASPVIYLNYSYAYVDTAASPGAVSFYATGLGVGDPWQLSFNGTTYSSNTPWINVTTQPGTFAVSASPVQAAFNDTAQYQASGIGPTQAVTIGSTYTVTYSPTYRVDVVASTGGTVTQPGSHWLAPGALATYTARPDANYAFLGWTGTGVGSYSGTNINASVTVGGPITESANFIALPTDRFNLTVTQSGLPSNVWWTVELDGIGYSTTGSTLLIPDLFPCSSSSGTYSVVVPLAYVNGTSGIQYVASGAAPTICTSGTTQLALTFTEEFLVTPLSTGGGSAAVQINGVPQSAPGWVKAGTSAGIEASAEAGYSFAGWVGQGPGNYTGPNAIESITPTGPVTEVATFTAVVPPPTPVYTVSFAETGLASGTAWSLVFEGTPFSSTTPWINVTGYPTATYTLKLSTVYSSDRTSQFTPTTTTTSVSVTGNLTGPLAVPVVFSVAYYVSIQGTTGGTVVSPSSGYVASGKTIELNATPSIGYSFVGWTGTGSSSYSGSASVTSVVVTAPIVEVATFAPIPAASTSNSGLGPNSTALIVGLAVVGLIVGLGVGFVIFRKRSSSSGGAPPGGGNA